MITYFEQVKSMDKKELQKELARLESKSNPDDKTRDNIQLVKLTIKEKK